MKIKTLKCKNGHDRIPLFKHNYRGSVKSGFIFDNGNSFSVWITSLDVGTQVSNKKKLFCLSMRSGKPNVYKTNKFDRLVNITSDINCAGYSLSDKQFKNTTTKTRLVKFLTRFFNRFDIEIDYNHQYGFPQNILMIKYPILSSLKDRFNLDWSYGNLLGFDKHDSLERYWKYNSDGSLKLSKLIDKFGSQKLSLGNNVYSGVCKLDQFLALTKAYKKWLSNKQVLNRYFDNGRYDLTCSPIIDSKIIEFFPKTYIKEMSVPINIPYCDKQSIKLLVSKGITATGPIFRASKKRAMFYNTNYKLHDYVHKLLVSNNLLEQNNAQLERFKQSVESV